MPDVPVAELAEEGGPPGAPGGRRPSFPGILLPPKPDPFGVLRARPLASMAIIILSCTNTDTDPQLETVRCTRACASGHQKVEGLLTVPASTGIAERNVGASV
jgi:hypothetical protein